MGMKKQCSCGEEYDTRAWSRLKLVGMLRAGTHVELRDCTCGSCMGRELSPDSIPLSSKPSSKHKIP